MWQCEAKCAHCGPRRERLESPEHYTCKCSKRRTSSCSTANTSSSQSSESSGMCRKPHTTATSRTSEWRAHAVEHEGSVGRHTPTGRLSVRRRSGRRSVGENDSFAGQLGRSSAPNATCCTRAGAARGRGVFGFRTVGRRGGCHPYRLPSCPDSTYRRDQVRQSHYGPSI
jgi:hypothetical protein